MSNENYKQIMRVASIKLVLFLLAFVFTSIFTVFFFDDYVFAGLSIVLTAIAFIAILFSRGRGRKQRKIIDEFFDGFLKSNEMPPDVLEENKSWVKGVGSINDVEMLAWVTASDTGLSVFYLSRLKKPIITLKWDDVSSIRQYEATGGKFARVIFAVMDKEFVLPWDDLLTVQVPSSVGFVREN